MNKYLIILATLITGSLSLAQTDAAAIQSVSVWDTISSGGIIGYAILCMSLCAVALVIENFLSIRNSVLLPEDHLAEISEHIKKNEIKEALDYCKTNVSFIAIIISAGLHQYADHANWKDIEKSIEDNARRQSGRFYRKLEYLTFIAASAPMLGLLGTVSGMMSAFKGIAIVEGAARSSQLASSISEALVTTFLGLIVAIPTLFFISVLRNRIETILTEAEEITENMLRPLKLLPRK
ncbi:MAG: MotA/TolQ/ExbB proton channel family protein [Sedimentisphaerales bacterium]|nr:MotA/TolQ/ExbB proton channel family protein [Sedimentisphaerales bacterium]MBN2842597.1 MotA/TolQ/ExbB proton channel family protein [Sedimentisphaerales bacterium]